ncbi:MAG: hypothetical protein H0V61_07735, partial [Chitinophagales bacterium]|nr:hypothetical protein [Chitinophagales bacterium]
MKLKFTVSPPSGRLALLFLILFSTAAMQAQTIKMGLGTVRTLPLDFYGYDMSTTVRGGVSCVDPDLLSHLPKLKPKTLRYPAGSHANWWNWRVGWYVDSPYLPEKQQKLKKVPNKLEDFKGLLTATGASAILDLNLLTSDVRDQIAMLKHADSIGIAIKYVELGNEFYLEGEEEEDTLLLLLKYPTPDSYADTAQIWIDSIHKHFPDVKIGLQGVFDKNHQERRNLWNDAVILPVEREDAITMHYYFGSHWPDPSETEAEKLNVNMGDLA